MLFSISILVIGLLIAQQIFTEFDRMLLWSHDVSFKVWIMFLIVDLILFGLFAESFSKIAISQLCLLSVPIGFFFAQERLRTARFRRNAVSVLDFLVLQMRSGLSLKESLQTAIPQFQMIQFDLKEILSQIQFETPHESSRSDTLFRDVSRELIDIHKGSFKSIDRLKALRSKIKTEQDFRRKMRQSVAQIKMQAAVLTLLYLGLLYFICLQYPFRNIETFLEISGFLFAMGLLALWFIPRTFRWKI